ncbi:mitotic checkpoint serine/threonine-protein kinase BUB1 [Austrofundulus limnaeus]|uniref:Mitotic checkpoint serine/threonine-protein kinase BUB1 n=1 Tax=Austrofundulus limnaeus TaxID=52670 RepID=A0A2I4C074_AUSLI|nr:PREDICTED: mitotic checkpoint serine/threonine-protein kinase BUB1 [Austrofundulus limnaeus]
MNIATYIQCFESSLSSYTGDDLLDPWDKFVEFLEQKLAAANGGAGASSGEMLQVLDALVHRFLGVDQYANDSRYINYCIRCASQRADPMALYSLVFSKGVGTRTAALYVAWAQQCEQKGLNEQAEAVFQKAVENQAQPADTVLHEYRQFQTRTRTRTQLPGGRALLQNSQLTNQMPSHSVSQNKPSDWLLRFPAHRMVTVVSRSETSGTLPPSSGLQAVSQYTKDVLVLEGSELCFEEVRAEKFFRQLRDAQEKQQKASMELQLRQQEDRVQRMKCLLDQVNQELETRAAVSGQTSCQQVRATEPDVGPVSVPPCVTNLQLSASGPARLPTAPSRLSSRRSLGLSLRAEPTFIQRPPSVPDPLQEVSQCPSVLPEPDVHRPVGLDHMNRSLIRTADVLHQSSSQSHGPSEPPLRDAPLRDAPLRDAPLRDAPLSDAPLRDAPLRDAPLRDVPLDRSHVFEPEDKLDVSQGGAANVSHITPNTSLGYVQATPSRVLPSPTVNTLEALGVIMDMFQGPTFLEEPLSNTSVLHAGERDGDTRTRGGISSVPKPPTTPFTIYQDEDKENCSSAGLSDKHKVGGALAELSVPKADKVSDTGPDLMPDESTMWGPRYNSLAACPNSTTDFALQAQFVSTPFTHKTPCSTIFFPDQESAADGGEAEENLFITSQTKKLSPIIEESPSDDKGSRSAVGQLPLSVRQGTIVGEGLTSTSTTLMQAPPPAVLSFRDQTLCPTVSSKDQTLCPTVSSRSAGPGWEVYTSPEQPPKPGPLSSFRPQTEPFTILEDLQEPARPEPDQNLDCDVPMSPECALKSNWLQVQTPQASAEQDLDAYLSPCRPKTSIRPPDVPMSPEQPGFCADVPMSPQQPDAADEPMMMSPDRGLRPTAGVQLVPDPWDSNLISDLLSRLDPPLTSDPRCFTWQLGVPRISPKVTISVGKASLRVERVLGEGAFATVYQAVDPVSSEKMVLKVQKPANPWEFYINTQLDARLQPRLRHLFSSVRSAHLFHDGSVLLDKLHKCGTLLNAVNTYRWQGTSMPQPLVLYFTVCILQMVQQLHAARIIHADIKPDNFMLGERFLENECLDPEDPDHGLVLIDLGQSIDMTLFPEGTAFTARCLTSGFQCTEMLSGKPWTYQTDYFGIAGTVYCLMFGTYMKVTNEGGVWRTNGHFRRVPHSDVWLDFFHTLLNVQDCGSLPSLQNLRQKLVSVLQDNYSNKLPALKRLLLVQLLEKR